MRYNPSPGTRRNSKRRPQFNDPRTPPALVSPDGSLMLMLERSGAGGLVAAALNPYKLHTLVWLGFAEQRNDRVFVTKEGGLWLRKNHAAG